MGNEAGIVKRVLRLHGVDPWRTVVEPVPGGFSGASVWRVRYDGKEYALKRWPEDQPAHVTLEMMHEAMRIARESGLAFVPVVVANRVGKTVVDGAGTWDLVSWQAGAPMEVLRPEPLRAAMLALAQLHAAWRTELPGHGVGTGVKLQHRRLSEWAAGELEAVRVAVSGDAVLGRAYEVVRSGREPAMQKLRPWLERKVRLQLCLGDVWSSHVLFTGDEVTGIVDYGGVRQDHPAQDLARLLGSYRLTAAERAVAVEAYPQRTAEVEELVPVLIETGRVVSLGNWLRWLVVEGRGFVDMAAVRKRVERLVE
jgi:Ser/Thr protein kinase RdoA (MazF antagonist)